MRISVIGTGYVGLVQGAVLADTGNHVICMDVDNHKIEMLKKGQIPIYEPGLEEIVRKNCAVKRLEFTIDLKYAVENSDVIFLCLPTPQSVDGSADISSVLEIAENIAGFLEGEKTIVSKSTVPVGTVDKLRGIFQKQGKANIHIVSNPEFLKEGAAVQDSFRPDRIVIGTSSEKAKESMMSLYAPFVRTGNPIIIMDEKSAELTKYAANAFLATKISFMNELANLCEKVGADIEFVRKGIGSDPRIGSQFLFAGVGYGGSCFPKDVMALVKTSEENNHEFKILKAVNDVNQHQTEVILRKIEKHFGKSLIGKTIAIWGLAFKPQTDDLRDAPSVRIILGLVGMGARIRAHDPVAMPGAKTLFKNGVDFADNAYDALKGSDALVVVTEWNEYRRPDFAQMSECMNRAVIFDGRNIYDPKEMREFGFVYYGIGR